MQSAEQCAEQSAQGTDHRVQSTVQTKVQRDKLPDSPLMPLDWPVVTLRRPHLPRSAFLLLALFSAREARAGAGVRAVAGTGTKAGAGARTSNSPRPGTGCIARTRPRPRAGRARVEATTDKGTTNATAGPSSKSPKNSSGFCKSVTSWDLETQRVTFSRNAPIGKRKKS